MVVGTTLQSGENREIDLVLDVVHHLFPLFVDRAHALAEEDHRAAGASEGLMGGGGDDVGVLEGRRDEPCSD